MNARQQAIAELERTIAAQFPITTFLLARGPDDLASIHLPVIADFDDPDEIGDWTPDGGGGRRGRD